MPLLPLVTESQLPALLTAVHELLDEQAVTVMVLPLEPAAGAVALVGLIDIVQGAAVHVRLCDP